MMIQTGSGQRWLLMKWVAERLGVSRQAVSKRVRTHGMLTWPVNKTEIAVLAEDVEAWEREREKKVST